MRTQSTLHLAVFMLAAVALCPAGAAAESPPNLGTLSQERTGLQESASQTRSQERAAVADLFALNRTLEDTRAAIARSDQEIAKVAGEQAAAEAERDRLEARRRERQAQFGRRARYFSEQGSFAPVGFLMAASSFTDFLFRIEVISTVMERDAMLMKELRTLKGAVEAQERVLSARRSELAALREQQATNEARQKTEIARKESILSGLREKRSDVENRVAQLEQVWTMTAKPVLEAFVQSLRSVAMKVGDITPDALKLSLMPPGASVRVTEKSLNAFLSKDADLKGLTFKLVRDEANLEGEFSGVTIKIAGRFVLLSKTSARYVPSEVQFHQIPLPKEVTAEMLAAGRLDMDFAELIKPWGIQEVRMEEGAMVVKAGM